MSRKHAVVLAFLLLFFPLSGGYKGGTAAITGIIFFPSSPSRWEIVTFGEPSLPISLSLCSTREKKLSNMHYCFFSFLFPSPCASRRTVRDAISSEDDNVPPSSSRACCVHVIGQWKDLRRPPQACNPLGKVVLLCPFFFFTWLTDDEDVERVKELW